MVLGVLVTAAGAGCSSGGTGSSDGGGSGGTIGTVGSGGAIGTDVCSAQYTAGCFGCSPLIGCSFVDVDVTVDNTNHPTVDLTSLIEINTCEATISGASSDTFTLPSCTAGTTYSSYDLGTFRYGTTAASGTIDVKIVLRQGDLTKAPLGQGTVSAAIAVGQHVPAIVKVVPDGF